MMFPAIGTRPLAVFQPQLVIPGQPVPAGVAGLCRRKVPWTLHKHRAVLPALEVEFEQEAGGRRIEQFASPTSAFRTLRHSHEVQIFDADNIVLTRQFFSQFPLPVGTTVSIMGFPAELSVIVYPCITHFYRPKS